MKSELIIAAPVKNPRKDGVDGALEIIADRFGYLAAEITLTRSALSYARAFLKALQKKYADIPIYLRFHTRVLPEYDPFFDGSSIKTLINFISDYFGGGFLILHSKSEVPDENALKRASQFVEDARKKGVVLCLENLAVGWSSEPELFRKALESTGLKGVLDLGHLNSSDCVRYARVNKIETVEKLLPYLCEAHIYDFEHNGHHPSADFELIGEALVRLKNSDIDWFTIELEEKEDFMMTLQIIEKIVQF